jgi:hypothetical protein
MQENISFEMFEALMNEIESKGSNIWRCYCPFGYFFIEFNVSISMASIRLFPSDIQPGKSGTTTVYPSFFRQGVKMAG